jgi:exodeoxyribonuclease VII large subunit
MSAGRSFFDPAKARGPRRGPDVGQDVTGQFVQTQDSTDASGREACEPGGAGGSMTVSQLIRRIKSVLTEAFEEKVTVLGELSNFKRHSSGHLYFRLKDATGAIDAVMWRTTAGRLKFEPTDGLEVVARGRVDLYDVQGRLQLYVESMQPKGQGALELAFRQLREKLEAEGLFAPEAKKPIPRFPRAIGVVTSPTGAAIRDIRRTLLRRWPGAKVYLVPVRVQGESAAGEISRALGALDASAASLEIDTILLARGGGSLEDLWAFNEEPVARALFAMHTPVICGVGHEVDVTIADLVADVRGATPTAAAELAVPEAAQVRQEIRNLHLALSRGLGRKVTDAAGALQAVLRSVVFRDPAWRVRSGWQSLDRLEHRLTLAVSRSVAARQRRLEPLAHRLGAQHPRLQVERGRSRLGRTLDRLRWVLGGRSVRESQRLSGLAGRLGGVHPRTSLKLARQKLESTARQLESLSHRSVLKRGFSVTRLEAGGLLRREADVAPGALLETELAEGKVLSRVQGAAPGPGPKKKPPRKSRPKGGDDPQQGKLF